MSKIVVVNNPDDWPMEIPGVEVVAAREYLMNPRFLARRTFKVFNLCRSYRYQSMGYYVSLLAAARGHRCFPGIAAIQEMKSPSIVRIITEDLDNLIQKSLSPLQSEKFTLSVYFGRNMARRYDQLSQEIFRLFQAPALRAFFSLREGKWRITSIQVVPANDIPEEHMLYVILFAEEYFSRKVYRLHHRKIQPYDMAVLLNRNEEEPPSNEKAIKKFAAAAEHEGFEVDILDREDYDRIPEYDALFIRETTCVNHHTFRFSQRAQAEGMVVIDDPDSIIQCSNKVYLAELLNSNHLSAPRTIIVGRENREHVPEQIGFPIILKKPDSSFSQGVVKVETPEDYERETVKLLDGSDLIIAQEFLPTEFDWRIGVLGGEPLFACKYFMAHSHWQIMDWRKAGKARYGDHQTVDMGEAPPEVVRLAVKIASLIGDGLYGVDIKTSGGQAYVIEINDNPNIDAGVEDLVLKDELYRRLAAHFLKRVQFRKDAR